MKKSTIGLLTTAIVGGIGLYAMSDKKMRKKIGHDSKKMLNKAGDLMSKMDVF